MGQLKLFEVRIGPATGKDGQVYGSHSKYVVILATDIDTAVELARMGAQNHNTSCPIDVEEIEGPFDNGDILAMWKS